MSIGVRIQGNEEAIKMMRELADKDQKKVIIRVQRKAARPVIRAARSIVSTHSQTVAKSIKAFIPRGGRRRENPILFVGPKRSRNRDADPWYAHIIEGGAKGVGRFSASGSYGARSVRAADSENDIFRFINSRRSGRERYRKDQQPKPFMEPAVNQNLEQVRQVMINDMAEHINKEVNRLKR